MFFNRLGYQILTYTNVVVSTTEVRTFPEQPGGDWAPNTSQQIARGRNSIMAAGERLLLNLR